MFWVERDVGFSLIQVFTDLKLILNFNIQFTFSDLIRYVLEFDFSFLKFVILEFS